MANQAMASPAPWVPESFGKFGPVSLAWAEIVLARNWEGAILMNNEREKAHQRGLALFTS